MSFPVPSGAQIMIDPKMLQEMEGPLMVLAQKSGGDLRKLLFAFFHFLNQRTDFYCVPHEDHLGNMGFREGDAEKLLLAAFRQFPLRKIPKQTMSPPTATTEKKKVKVIETTNATAEITTKEEDKKQTTTSKNDDETRYTEEGRQIPVGNGGAVARYRWTQSLEETSVVVAVPEGTRGRDLEVTIKPSSIVVKMKPTQDTSQSKILLEGELVEHIQTHESTWTLEGGCLLLVLQKQKKTWWDTVIQGDERIDTTLVDSTRKVDSYDETTQAHIRKILFDQRQERLGLKTSDQITRDKGQKPTVPQLPAGVEYIDRDTLENHAATTSRKNRLG